MDLETRVALLESQMQILSEQTIPLISNQVDSLFTQVQSLQQLVLQLQTEVLELETVGAKNKKLITILMSYAVQKLLSPSNPNADSALWTNLKELAGE